MFGMMEHHDGPFNVEVGEGSNYSNPVEITESRAIRQFRLTTSELSQLQPVSAQTSFKGVIRKYRTQDVLDLRQRIIERAMIEGIDEDKEIPIQKNIRFIFETEARNKYEMTSDDLKDLDSFVVQVDQKATMSRFYRESDIREVLDRKYNYQCCCCGSLGHRHRVISGY